MIQVSSIAKPLFDYPIGDRLCGVYFLMHNDMCMYIGHSNNIYYRIGQHQAQKHKNGKFNNVRFLQTRGTYRDIIETHLIGYFRPPLNIDIPRKTKSNSLWAEVENAIKHLI